MSNLSCCNPVPLFCAATFALSAFKDSIAAFNSALPPSLINLVFSFCLSIKVIIAVVTNPIAEAIATKGKALRAIVANPPAKATFCNPRAIAGKTTATPLPAKAIDVRMNAALPIGELTNLVT